MGSKSKNKGNSFEREIAKYLTKIFGKPFLRTPGSGAFVGGGNAVKKRFLDINQIKVYRGDIVPPDDFMICIECKNYAEFPFHQLLFNKQIQILKGWIHEIEFDAIDDQNIFWLLIFKIDRKGTFVLWDNSKYDELDYIIQYDKKYAICELHNFFENNSVKILKYIA